jgi:hypothetical protein
MPESQERPETTPPSESPGRSSVPVDRAVYGQFGVTERDLFLGDREAEAGEIRAAGPPAGDVLARSAGTSPETSPRSGASRRRRNDGEQSESSRRSAFGSRSSARGRSPEETPRSSTDSSAPAPARPLRDPRALDDPGFDWSGLEDPIVDVPLHIEEIPVIETEGVARPLFNAALRVRRGDVAWSSCRFTIWRVGPGRSSDGERILLDRNRSRNHVESRTPEQGFRVVWT